MTVPGHIKPLLLVLTVLGGGYSGSVKNSSIDQELDSDGLLREMYANVVGKHSTAAEPRKLVWHRICWELENTVRPKQGEKYYTLNKVPQPTCLLKEDKVVLNADDLECSAMGGRFETIEWCSYTLNCDKNVSEDEGCNDINKDGVPACDSTRSCDIKKLCDDPQSWLAEDFVLRCSRQKKRVHRKLREKNTVRMQQSTWESGAPGIVRGSRQLGRPQPSTPDTEGSTNVTHLRQLQQTCGTPTICTSGITSGCVWTPDWTSTCDPCRATQASSYIDGTFGTATDEVRMHTHNVFDTLYDLPKTYLHYGGGNQNAGNCFRHAERMLIRAGQYSPQLINKLILYDEDYGSTRPSTNFGAASWSGYVSTDGLVCPNGAPTGCVCSVFPGVHQVICPVFEVHEHVTRWMRTFSTTSTRSTRCADGWANPNNVIAQSELSTCTVHFDD